MYHLDKRVDVLTPPVCAVGVSPVVVSVRRIVLVSDARGYLSVGIRIEVVVGVDPVDVVAAYDIGDHRRDVVANLRQSRVQHHPSIGERQNPLGVDVVDVVRRQMTRVRGFGPKWVEPGV